MLRYGRSEQARQRAPDDRIAIGAPHARLFVRGAIAAVGRPAAEAELGALWVTDRPLAGVGAQLGHVPDQPRALGRRRIGKEWRPGW